MKLWSGWIELRLPLPANHCFLYVFIKLLLCCPPVVIVVALVHTGKFWLDLTCQISGNCRQWHHPNWRDAAFSGDALISKSSFCTTICDYELLFTLTTAQISLKSQLTCGSKQPLSHLRSSTVETVGGGIIAGLSIQSGKPKFDTSALGCWGT